MPNVTGRAGEVVLVMNSPVWESESGRALGRILSSEHPGLVQFEPMFEVVRIGHAAFTNIFKTHRNIIIVNISSQYSETQMTIKNNVWAKPQVVLEINAPDMDAFHIFIDNQDERILEELVKAERNRITEYIREMEKTSVTERVEEKFDISIIIPRGYNIVIDTSDFVWVRFDPRRITQDIIQGIFIYQFDYTDPETFTPGYLVDKRNEFLKNYISGPSPDSWMTTEMLVEPVFSEFMKDEKYVAELKGLWKVENDFMGGPFISHTKLNEETNKVVTVECFVYAPGQKKRNLLRQVEAILYTYEIKE